MCKYGCDYKQLCCCQQESSVVKGQDRLAVAPTQAMDFELKGGKNTMVPAFLDKQMKQEAAHRYLLVLALVLAE